MTETVRHTLLLIDANSLIHRAFHALPPLTDKNGRPIQAVYGVASILLKIWREQKPMYATALFDRPEPTLRKQQYDAYKAHRPPAPDTLVEQIIETHNLFACFGVRTFELPGFEADDLIATLAQRFWKTDKLQVVVLTGDLDTLQLVRNETVVVRVLRKGVSETELYDEKAVQDRFGLAPEQLVDYKALVGDPSDNIPGVPGVGAKTAVALLKKFRTLEMVYGRLKEVSIAEKLGAFEKQARLSRSLVLLDRDAPFDAGSLNGLRVDERGNDIKEYFKSKGFSALLKRLANKEKSVLKRSTRQIQGKMF